MKVSMKNCRTNLFILWVIGSIILVIIMWLQIAGNHYGDKGRQAIDWLLPSISPTLALVAGVWADDAKNSKKKTEYVKKKDYRITFFISIGYFVFLLFPILSQPFIASDPLDFLTLSKPFIVLAQVLVTAAIGIFFVQKA